MLVLRYPFFFRFRVFCCRIHQAETAAPSLRQTVPKILNNGNIALFDNYGGNNENGRSRIYILDPKTKKMIGSINGDNNNYFFSATRGHVHEGKVNNEFFITSSNQGIIYYSKCNDIIRECTIKNIINSNNIITDFNLY